jgi:eukaryotic-like serine/threonine-protein kinase
MIAGAELGELGNNRFEVRRRIGQGGFGVVFEAFDKERGELVALKTLRVMDAESVYRFKREFRALAEMTHPNLVALHELFADGDTWFFTMELVRGVDFLSFVTHGEDVSLDDSAPTESTLDRASNTSTSTARPRARRLPFDEPRLRHP